MAGELDGRVALVTGGGTGIGAAIAEGMARAGARVVVVGRTMATLAPVAQRSGGEARLCDVTDADQVAAVFDAVRHTHGRLDILVANAGASGPIAPVVDLDMDQVRTNLELNVMGALHCLQAAGRIMVDQGSGSIVVMSSRMGVQGYPMRASYCAGKFALIGITQAVARELGPHNVRVNALCPGAVSGELMDRVLARRAAAEGRDAADIARAEYTDVAALRRWVDPAQVASAAVFLASDASAAITGDRLMVDCGRF